MASLLSLLALVGCGRAFSELQMAAKKGNSEAQLKLGERYRGPIGPWANVFLRFGWFRAEVGSQCGCVVPQGRGTRQRRGPTPLRRNEEQIAQVGKIAVRL